MLCQLQTCRILTLNLLTTTIVAPPSNASKWQMRFNLAFKGLTRNTVMNSEEKNDVLTNLYFHSSLDCPFNNSDYKPTNRRMNSQLGRKWRDVGHNLRHCCGTAGHVEENHKDFNQIKVSHTRFKPRTCKLQSSTGNHSTTMFDSEIHLFLLL
jgi:hypothetical protein